MKRKRSADKSRPRTARKTGPKVQADELRSNASHREPVIDREAWVKKLEQLQSLTAAKKLRPSQEILDELRADRI